MTYSVSQRDALRKYLDALDKAIGELTVVRYDIATELLAADSEHDKAREHYADAAAQSRNGR